MINLRALASLLLLAAGGCSNTNSANPTRNYLGTQSPGDVWSWSITPDNASGGTFSSKNQTLGLTYSGTLSTLPNGFLKLAITATNDPAVGPTDYFYGFEVPNTGMLIKPIGNQARVIIAAAQGDCPTSSGAFNWIAVPAPGWNATTSVAYGFAASTMSGATFDFNYENHLLSGAAANPATRADHAMSCAAGAMGNGSTTIGLTPSGIFIGDLGPGSGGFAGMPAPANNIDVGATGLLAAGKEYRGVLYKYDSTGPQTVLVWGRPNASGGLDGGPYLDFEAGTEDVAHKATFAFTAQAKPGLVTGSETGAVTGATSSTTMVINQVNGKYVQFGIFLSDETSVVGKTQPQYFLAMEK